MGIRGKLFVFTLVFVGIIDLLVGIYLESELRDEMRSSTTDELTRHARSARALLAPQSEIDSDVADRVADDLGRASEARITIITPDGAVIGDSSLDYAALQTVDNHADRPEVVAALQGRHGVASRESGTVGTEMLYAAIPFETRGERWVVRAAVPLHRVEAAIGEMRAAVAVAGVLSLALAAVLLVVLSKLVSNTLRTMVSAAQAAASGQGPSRTSEDATVGSIRRLTDDLESAMQTLAAERNRFQAVLETMDQAVLALDAAGRVTTVNRAARALLNLRQEVKGLKLVEAVRIPALMRLVEDAQAGELKRAEFDLPGGRRVEARATTETEGGVVIAMLDVTEIRRLERVRRDFVANVSHELRTPISVIRANTETLLAGALDSPEQARTFTDAVNRHAERLGRLVSDLLDISRIEAGRYPLSIQPVNACDAIEHVLDMLQVEADNKDIEIAADVAADLELLADKKALDQVLVNLVTNAIKYTPAHGHVEISAMRAGERIRVEVADDGPGVDPAHRERIFERFYRVDPGRSRDMGGTGLGLSIVKHLVDAMDGQVGVDPRSPKGSRFWFALAAASPTAASSRAANEGPPDGTDKSDGSAPSVDNAAAT